VDLALWRGATLLGNSCIKALRTKPWLLEWTGNIARTLAPTLTFLCMVSRTIPTHNNKFACWECITALDVRVICCYLVNMVSIRDDEFLTNWWTQFLRKDSVSCNSLYISRDKSKEKFSKWLWNLKVFRRIQIEVKLSYNVLISLTVILMQGNMCYAYLILRKINPSKRFSAVYFTSLNLKKSPFCDSKHCLQASYDSQYKQRLFPKIALSD
jgi:hypothetical protein